MKYSLLLLSLLFSIIINAQDFPVTSKDSIIKITIQRIEKVGVITPPPPTNQKPTANAGGDKSITLPTNSVSLAGSGTDADGTITKFAWSGTGLTFSNANAATTNVTGLTAGIYTARLTVTDNSGAVAFDDVVISVNAAPPSGQVKYLELPKQANRTISNQSNVVIENMQFANIVINSSSNITIRNCYFSATSGESITINQGCSNVTIEKCLFANMRTGVYAVHTTGNIKVINCQFVNAKGPFPRGQFVQFNTGRGPGNEVTNCQGENFTGRNDAEDMISLYQTIGTAASPVTVRGNSFRGGGPSNSGGGIMSGDFNGEFALVENNKLFNPGQYGIAVAGGHNITIRNNQVYAEKLAGNNIGFYLWAQSGATCGDISFSGNRSNYTNAAGAQNNYWNAGNCNPCSCSAPSSISVSEIAFPAHLITFLTVAELNSIK